MKGYKGFGKGLVCKGKQYAENTVFEEDRASICKFGMHFCENPFDVLDYYPLFSEDGTPNEFAEVEALDDAHTSDHKKYCTKKLKVGAKLTVSKFINDCVDFVIENTSFSAVKSTVHNTGYSAKIGSSGDSAKIGSSGYSAQITCDGNDSVICCAGHDSIVKAKQGCWITLSEWSYSEDKERYVPICVKTEFVDGERIKPDTWYKLVDGEFVEAEYNEV